MPATWELANEVTVGSPSRQGLAISVRDESYDSVQIIGGGEPAAQCFSCPARSRPSAGLGQSRAVQPDSTS